MAAGLATRRPVGPRRAFPASSVSRLPGRFRYDALAERAPPSLPGEIGRPLSSGARTRSLRPARDRRAGPWSATRPISIPSDPTRYLVRFQAGGPEPGWRARSLHSGEGWASPGRNRDSCTSSATSPSSDRGRCGKAAARPRMRRDLLMAQRTLNRAISREAAVRPSARPARPRRYDHVRPIRPKRPLLKRPRTPCSPAGLLHRKAGPGDPAGWSSRRRRRARAGRDRGWLPRRGNPRETA